MKTKKQGLFYSGTSGLVLPVPNKSFYPPAFRDQSRLTYYASLYNSIEDNGSFYRIPQRRTTERQAASVPEHFRFTFKLFRDITHQKGLRFDPALVGRFLESVGGVGEKKGCLLLQLPPGTKSEAYGQLETLLTEIRLHPKSAGWRLSVEFRDSSWYIGETWELLEEFDAVPVYHDMPKSLLAATKLRRDWVYLRFHGVLGDYRGSYPPDRLAATADIIRQWRQQGKTVFVYFNNTIGEAGNNLLALNRLVGETAPVK